MALQNLTLCDQQHSVLASAGTARSYPPYGALPAAIGPRLAYCGQAREASTGFYQLGNGYRSYDPCLMRFLSPDALSPFAKGGINAYAYCAGDPINYQDRNGRNLIPNPRPRKKAEGFVPGLHSARAITNSTGSVEYSSTLASTFTTEASEGVVKGPGWSPWTPISATAAGVHVGVAIGLAKKDLKGNFWAVGANLVAGVVHGAAAAVSWWFDTGSIGGGGEGLLKAQIVGRLGGAQLLTTAVAGAVMIAKPSAKGRQATESFELKEVSYKTPAVENEANLPMLGENKRIDVL